MLETRAEAAMAGEKVYMTGKPCPYGHVDVRYTKTGQCKSCVRETSRARWKNKTGKTRQRWDTASIVEKFRSVHADLYEYSKVIYTRHKDKVSVVCKTHGEFLITPDNHLRGKGCRKCETDRRVRFGKASRGDLAEFVTQGMKVWGGAYSYEKVVYKGAHDKCEITCGQHGPFWQTPTNHLAGKVGCTKCNHMKSTGESEVAQFLSIFTTVQTRDRKIIAPKELDIVLTEHALAVEYCGVYWHSHKDEEAEEAGKWGHYRKFEACRNQGIRLITIFENEWKERKFAVKRLLRNAIGKSRGKVMARKCEVRVVEVTEARAFFEKYHPQGGTGNGKHYGLFYSGKLVACMRFTHGANDRGRAGSNRTWTLTRYATRITVSGGASRLLKAFIRDVNPPEVKSFSDNRYFEGGMYQSLGFVMEEESAPDYQVWSPKIGLRPKSHYQRRALPARQRDHGVEPNFDPATDPRTEAQMTYELGCRRLYDCGKKRWVLHPHNN